MWCGVSLNGCSWTILRHMIFAGRALGFAMSMVVNWNNSIPAWSRVCADTERYLGCKQNLEKPVNDRFGCLFSRTAVDLR